MTALTTQKPFKGVSMERPHHGDRQKEPDDAIIRPPPRTGEPTTRLPLVEVAMTGRRRDVFVQMPAKDFEDILERAAQRGARKALADVGLDGASAAQDVRDLRVMLSAIREAKRTAWVTAVKMLVAGLLMAILAGVAIRMKALW